MRVTPSLSQRGRQHAGAGPLVPPYLAILHGASPDEAASARGPIAYQYNFSQRISPEQKKEPEYCSGLQIKKVFLIMDNAPMALPRRYGAPIAMTL